MSLTQLEIARHLDMSERNARDVLRGLGIDHRQSSLDEIRIAYIRDMREKAAGRGGSDQASLTRRKAEEAEVNTALKRVQLHEAIGSVVQAQDAAEAITDWSSFANREYLAGITKLVSEIQIAYKIEIDGKKVEDIAGPTIARIKSHAEKLGRDFTESIGDVLPAKVDTDGGVD